jgi:iron-sulfur cluster repair protein YtfE (RIC family)
MNYQRLMDEHDRIDAALATLYALSRSARPDLPAVIIGLSDLAGELDRHLAHEDSFIYPRMISGASGGASDVALAFIDDFARLRADWALYLREWTTDAIAADWTGFREETQSMMARLADRVKAENTLLYAAALQASAIQLRDAA